MIFRRNRSMKINLGRAISLFCGIEPTEPQLDGYVFAKVKPGAKIVAKFEDEEYYLIITDNTIPLFSNNAYYGAILVERKIDTGRAEEHSEMHRLYIHARVIAFSDIGGEFKVGVIGNNSDIIWDTVAQNDQALREHFGQVYWRLRKDDPMKFEEQWGHLLSLDLDFHLVDDHIMF